MGIVARISGDAPLGRQARARHLAGTLGGTARPHGAAPNGGGGTADALPPAAAGTGLRLPARRRGPLRLRRARPRKPDDPLFRCPCHNVFDTGRICVGTHPFPRDPARVPIAFFSSYFSAHPSAARGKSRRHPDDIGALWAELHRATVFPVDDLVPQFTVADALRLGTDEGRRW